MQVQISENQMKEAVDLDWNEENEFWNSYRLSDGTLLKVKVVLKGVKRLKECGPDGNPIYTINTDMAVRALEVQGNLKQKPKPPNMNPV